MVVAAAVYAVVIVVAADVAAAVVVVVEAVAVGLAVDAAAPGVAADVKGFVVVVAAAAEDFLENAEMCSVEVGLVSVEVQEKLALKNSVEIMMYLAEPAAEEEKFDPVEDAMVDFEEVGLVFARIADLDVVQGEVKTAKFAQHFELVSASDDCCFVNLEDEIQEEVGFVM